MYSSRETQYDGPRFFNISMNDAPLRETTTHGIFSIHTLTTEQKHRGRMHNTVITTTSKLKSSYGGIVSKSVCITSS